MSRPCPDNIGPYDVLQLLGQGGMGMVYLARHKVSGQHVALKTLKVSGRGRLKALGREIRALRMLNHPGVVKVLDDGVDGGKPWFAMALLKGRTLSSHLREGMLAPSEGAYTPPRNPESQVWTVQLDKLDVAETMATFDSAFDDSLMGDFEPLPDVSRAPAPRLAVRVKQSMEVDSWLKRPLDWVAQIADALAYVHGEGLAHLDLKPDNILITESGKAVLLDFGLAQRLEHRVSAEALEGVGIFAGTARYIAPEQALSRPVDSRADLYALGCILYRIVVGRAPFVGPDAIVLARQHISMPPEPPSAMGVLIPPALESLIMRLLSKAPHQRPPHAGVVKNVLVQVGAAEAEAPIAKTHLYQSECLGRSALEGRLMQHFEAVMKGESRSVALVGESGVGKSRLVQELVRQVRRHDARVVVCHSQAPLLHDGERQTGPPLHTFDNLLERAAGLAQGHEGVAARLVGESAAALAPYCRAFEAFVQGGQAPRGPAAATALSAAIQGVMAAFEDKPLVLIFEDVQWIDALSLSHLGALLGGLDQRCLALCLSQVENVPEGVEALLARPEIERQIVPRLEDETIEHIVRQMMSTPDPPASILSAVVTTAGGNPLFAIESLRLALDRGALKIDGMGVWRAEALQGLNDLPMPQTVQDLIEARLSSLPLDAERVLAAAAVLGRDTDAQLLAESCGLGEQARDGALAVLEQRAVLEIDGAVIRFNHGGLREVVYARISQDERLRLHQSAAAALEHRRTEGVEVDLGSLALHMELTERRGEAAALYTLAGEAYSERFVLDEAERVFKRAMALADASSPTAVRARWKYAKGVLLVQSRMDEAEAHLNASISMAKASGETLERSGALMALSQLFIMTGRLEETDAALDEACALLEAHGDTRRLGHAHTLAGIAAYNRGDNARAVSSWTWAAEVGEASGDLRLATAARLNTAMVHTNEGRYRQARHLQEAALAFYRSIDHVEGVVTALNNICWLLCCQGDLADFDRLSAEAEEVSKRLGDPYNTSFMLHARGVALRQRGLFEASREALQAALDMRHGFGNAALEAEILLELAALALAQDHLGEAIERAMASKALFGEDTDGAARAQILRAQAFRLQGALEDSRTALQSCVPRLMAQSPGASLIAVLCEQGYAAHAQGEDAGPWLEKARVAFESVELDPESEPGLQIAALRVALGAF